MAQYRYSTLALKGKEKPMVSSMDHLCNLPGCFKYINAGDWMVRVKSGGYDLHVDCAEKWCNEHGIDANYKE